MGNCHQHVRWGQQGLFPRQLRRARPKLDVADLKQWGIAINMYAGDNKDSFPDNSGGHDLSWMSPTLNEFYKVYLFPNHRGTTVNERNRNDVLYCPTDDWHRVAEMAMITSDTDPQLIGYFS